MAKGRKTLAGLPNQKPIEQYNHTGKERLNNPPVGLVSDFTDTDYGQVKKKYTYDPHLDPQLQWAGKAEHTSFEVPVVSLHVHERIDPKTIIETVKKEDNQPKQMSLFETHDKPLREAVEFYKHKENWSNRMIAGDSLLVMNSLLEKEGMGGKVQMMYFDPPYGIKYGSNFQPFVNKRDVKDGSDEDLTQEPEMIKAFRDTWELGIHSYLTYLRDRLLLAKELLHESGSVFVQISDENVHHVREIMDEVFGKENWIAQIVFAKTSGYATNFLTGICDYILWYGKDIKKVKYKQLYYEKKAGETGASKYNRIMLPDGSSRNLTSDEILGNKPVPDKAKFWVDDNLTSQGNPLISFTHEGRNFTGTYKTTIEGLKKLAEAKRLYVAKDTLRYIRYIDDFPAVAYNAAWMDIGGVQSRTDPKIFVVQTSNEAIKRCLIMTSDPGEIVLDITCGSGTTAFVAEQWGRRWITCDTSRVALSLAKQRLMTANFNYYQLARPEEGVGSGFKYKTVPHISLKSIVNKEPAEEETLFDQPFTDNKRTRITGPFTVESIPAPVVKDLEGILETEMEADNSVSRSGETLRQDQWRDELYRSGVRAKGGAMIHFSRVEALAGTKYIQAQGETKPALREAEGGVNPERVLIVFGPEHAPLEQRTVEQAIDEARFLKPDILLFCAFQFDDEAAKDIDEIPEKLIGFKLLKALMNMDLQTDDLKKNRCTNQSFWLIGQPDVRVHEINEGDDKGKVQVEVQGFDYYNPKTGAIESGGKKNIAMWLLDTDYDGRSMFPKQVFFPMSGSGEGWDKLAKNLKAEIDEEKIEAFNGTVSLAFFPGKVIAVKIIDDRGIESLKIIKR
jgi:adenine-specific DNA-methyltransferase